MQAGKLNQRVKIQYLNAGQDATGQPVQTWSDFATVWANVRYQTGIEAINTDAVVSLAKASVRIRYRSDITAGMRVLHGTIAMDIKAVLPDETGKTHVDLACVAAS
jgi:SPP1 family predicted phage head-tail adaptor